MDNRLIRFILYASLLPMSVSQRAIFPGRMTLPDNRPGNKYPTIPGVNLPDTMTQPDVSPEQIPLQPYNHALGLSFTVPRNRKGTAVGIGMTPTNTMDYPANVLLPVFQAEQIRNGRHQSSILPNPTISKDRQHLLPTSPFTTTVGYEIHHLRPLAEEYRLKGFIDFPVSWKPGHGRFHLDGEYFQQPRMGYLNIPFTEIKKKWYLQGRAHTSGDWQDFHFGQVIRPANPLNLDIAEAYRRGDPLWQPFANSLQPNENELFTKRTKT